MIKVQLVSSALVHLHVVQCFSECLHHVRETIKLHRERQLLFTYLTFIKYLISLLLTSLQEEIWI